MGSNTLPPLPPAGLARLRSILLRIRPECRDEAIQESWIAYLRGGSPVGAVVSHWKRIKRLRDHERPVDPDRAQYLVDARYVSLN